MWSYEHTLESTASVEALWRIWSDVATWPAWNGDIAAIEIDGPFAPGSRITMTPLGAEPVTLTITAASPEEGFTDEARLGAVVVRTVHQARRVAAGHVVIVYRTEVTGSAAAQQIGEAITADFPQTMAALAARAEGISQADAARCA